MFSSLFLDNSWYPCYPPPVLSLSYELNFLNWRKKSQKLCTRSNGGWLMGQIYAEKRPQDLCSSPPAPHILRGKESHFEQETSTFSKTIRLVWNTSSFSLHHKSSLVKIENLSCLILEFKFYQAFML